MVKSLTHVIRDGESCGVYTEEWVNAKKEKKNISQKLPEGSNSFTGNLLSYFNIQCYEDIHTHIRSWAKANQNQSISQKIVCEVTL